MARTRIQTGSLTVQSSDPLTLQAQASSLTLLPTSPTTTSHSPKYPESDARNSKRKPSTTTKTPRSPIKRNPPSTRSKNPPARNTNKSNTALLEMLEPTIISSKPRIPADFRAQMRLGSFPLQRDDICEGINFFPRKAFGAREEEGRSALQRAELEVEVWEEVMRAHLEGGLERVVPVIGAVLKGCRREVKKLKMQDGASIVGVLDPGAVAISERIKALEWALSTSEFEPEKRNITAAIAGYQSGEIEYSEQFTILFAGHIVDTAATYADFAHDRHPRLDHYVALHGPGWLWYEPPLNVHPESKPKMMRSLALPQHNGTSGFGCYYINQGFWKRAGLVMRQGSAKSSPQFSHKVPFQRLPDGTVSCQEDGPKLAFRLLVDSGATYPCLYKADFARLMIDLGNYGAQTVETLCTANGNINARLYEMFVCVLGEDLKHLVNESQASWPHREKYLGGLCPVALMDASVVYDEKGQPRASRLSGMLPFMACYISSTPSWNTMFLGEDRGDVLGVHRMPGQRRWGGAERDAKAAVEAMGDWDRYGNPKTAFVHQGGWVIDMDDPNKEFASTVTFAGGTENEDVIRICPGENAEEDAAEKARNDDATSSGLDPFEGDLK